MRGSSATASNLMTAQDSVTGGSVPFVEIAPTTGWVALHLKDLWDYRELLYFLTLREIKVRYKQTAIGAAWALIQPLFTMLVFTLFFGRLAKIQTDGIPYSVFSLSGLVIWTFFANGLSTAANSLVANSNLVNKVYFPRLIVPVSAILSGSLDFVISFAMLLVVMAINGIYPGLRIIWMPAFFFMALGTALGIGLWLAALNVEYRDVRYVIPFLLQFWMFSTPIAYPSSLLHEPWRTVYALNPMVGVIDGFRWCLLGSGKSPGPAILVSSLVAILMMISGAYYFRRMERTFADIV
jgi:lipopolysaccharide transport system permease protein